MALFLLQIKGKRIKNIFRILGLFLLFLLPLGEVSAQDISICEGEPLTGQDLFDLRGLSASDFGDGEWHKDGSGVDFDDKKDPNTGIFDFSIGDNTFHWEDKDVTPHVEYSFTVEVVAPPSTVLPVTISGTGCSGTTHTITVTSAQSGVTYRLYRDNTSGTPVAIRIGTGADLSFPGQTMAGTYIVTADNGDCIPVELNGKVTIQPTPEIYNITGTSGCQGTPVSIGVSNAQSGVTYRVIRTDGAGIQYEMGSVVAGSSGSPITIGSYSAIGSYTVVAQEPGGCDSDMNGSVVITATPTDVPFENTSVVCNTGEVAINPSQNSVQYFLVRNGTLTGDFRNGNGGRIVFSGLGTGTYSIIARSQNNSACEILLSDTRVIQATPPKPTLSASATEYCLSGLSGITLTSPGTVAGVSYQLFKDGVVYDTKAGGGSLVWNDVTAGDYFMVATTTGGCTSTMDGTVTITENTLPTATIHVYSASFRRCEGAANPGFEIEVVLTGNSPFNFEIVDHNNVIIAAVNNYSSNSYRLSVDPVAFQTTYRVRNLVDFSSCNPVSGTGTAVFYVDPVPAISFNPAAPEVCLGSTVAITASGAGTGGSYQWSDGLGSNPVINVGPTSDNTYTVTAISQYGCRSTSSVDVKVNALPVVDFTPPVKPGDDYSVCINNGDISLTPSPSGGSFSGNGIVASTNIFNTVDAGINPHDITYTYSDGKGCVNSVTKRMVVNALPVVSISGIAHDYCADDPQVTMRGNPTNSRGQFNVIGHTASQGIMWDDNGDGTGWFSPSGVLNAGSGPGTYTIEYSYSDLNGCINTTTWDVTVHLDVSDNLDITGLPGYMCETDGPVTIQAWFGDPLAQVHTNAGWFDGPGITDNGDGTATFDPSTAHSGLHSITYTYTDPISNCSGSYSQDIQIGTTLTFNIDALYCYGDAAVVLNGNPAGGIFNIYDGAGVKIGSGADGSVSFDPSVLLPGDYQVEYVYVVGTCVNTLVQDVEVVANPDATFQTGILDAGGNFLERTNFCVTTTNAVLRPTVLPVQGNFSGPSVSGTTFNPKAAGLGTHTIRYTVVNASGCETIEEVLVDVVDLPEIDIDNLNPTYCDNELPFTIQANTHGVTGGVFNLSSTSNSIGVSPLTDIDNVTGEAKFNPALVGPGVYWVSLEYTHPASGCTNTVTEEVEVFAATAVNFGGLADVMSYCRSSEDVILTASFNNGTPVAGGVFTISTGVGLTDHGDGTATLKPSALVVGNYDVTYTYTNSNGCETSRTKTISILPFPTAFDVNGGGNYCIGGPGREVTLSSSQVGVDYELLINDLSLSPAVVFAGTGNPLNFGFQTLEGNYTVNAINLGSSCEAMMTGSVDIALNDIALTFSNQQNVSCFNGNDAEVTVTASGGSVPYVYLWEREVPSGSGNWVAVSSAAHATGLIAGTYRVTVTDGISCSKVSGSVVITQPSDFSIVVNAADIVPVGCYGTATGGFTVTASPASGSYQFSIDGGSTWQNAPSFMGLIAGTYWVSVRNTASACEKLNLIEVEVTEPANPLTISNSVITNVACYGGANGEVEVTLTGGTPDAGGNYVYQWYRIPASGSPIPVTVANGGNTSHIVNRSIGTYRVVVTDANSCQVTDDYVVTQPSDWSVDYDFSHVTTFGSNDGTISVNTISGQTAPYSVSLLYPDMSVQAGMSHSGLPAGNYFIQIEDAAGCTTSIPVTITQPGDLLVNITGSDVTCTDGSNGFIQVSITQGNAPFTINWSGNLVAGGTLSGSHSGTNANYTINDGGNGLPAGTYTVNVVDNVGDTFSQVLDVSEPAALSINKILEKNISCSGAADGEVGLSITTSRPAAETDNYLISWSGPNGFSRSGILGDPTLTQLTNLVNPGIYTVTIYYGGASGNFCFVQEQFTITEPNALVINVDDVQPVSCHGETTGSISVSTTGRPVGTVFNYTWEFNDGSGWVAYAATGASINNLAIGRYRVTAREVATGCETIPETITIIEPDAITLNAVKQDVTTCNGSSDGTVTLTVNGGSTPYLLSYGSTSVNWDGSAALQALNLSAGSYTFTVLDANNCSEAVTVTITEPEALVVENVAYNIACETPNSGTLDFDVTGGRIVGGTHGYSVSLIHQSSGANYGQTIASTTNQPYSVSISGLPAGDYQLRVTDRNSTTPSACPYVFDFSLRSIQIAAVLADANCKGVNSGSISLSITGGSGDYSYQWTKAEDALFNRTTKDLGSLSAGTYQLVLTDNVRGCTLNRTYTLGNAHTLIINGSEKDVTCPGSGDGAVLSVSVSDPSSATLAYSWSGGTLTPPVNTADISGVGAGTYQLTVTDGNGCVAARSFVVEEPSAITFDLTTDIENCDPYSRSVTLDNLTGGTGTITDCTFSWSGPGTTTSSQNLNGLTVGGTYEVTVRDANDCPSIKSIVVPSQIKVTETLGHLNCFGDNNGTIVLQVTGGSGSYSYNWTTTDGSGLVATDMNQAGLTAGTYTVTVTDNVEAASGSSCSVTKDFIITQPNEIIVTGNLTDVICTGDNDGAITLNVTGGTGNYSYSWSSADGSGWVQGVKDQSGLSGGTYSVIVTDDNGCTAMSSFNILEPAPLVINKSIEKDITCFSAADGELAIGITTTRLVAETNNYAVTWTGPDGFSLTGTLGDATVTHLTNLANPGIYTVTIFYGGASGNSCSIQEQFTITEPDPIEIIVDDVQPVSCNGGANGSITVSTIGRAVGTVFSYSWEFYDGSVWMPYAAAGASINNLASGQYRVTARVSATGCETTSAPIEVLQPEDLQLTAVKQDVTTCNGASDGSVTLTVNGGSTPYLLSYGTTSVNWDGSSAYVAANLMAGDYTFEVTDAHNCSDAVSVTITEPEALVVDNVIYNIACETPNSGTLDLDISGGRVVAGNHGYTISLIHQASGVNYGRTVAATANQPHSVALTNLPAGDYQLRVTDRNSTTPSACPYVQDFSLRNIQLDATVLDATCKGVNSGSISLTITGGSGSYTYQWTKTEDAAFSRSTKDLGSLSAGTYQLAVTDNVRGCVLNRSYTVGNAHTLVINGAEKDVTCAGSADGAVLNVSVSDPSSATLSYSWTGGTLTPPVSTADISGLGGGSYQLSVTDGNGCVATRNFVVVEPAPITYDLSTAIENCDPYSRSVTLSNLAGGTGALTDYTFSWSGPGITTTSQNLTGLTVGGTYTLEVRDVNDCPSVQSILVSSQIKVTQTVSHLDCYGDNNGSIVLHVTGGSGNYSYSWTTPDGSGLVPADKDQTGLTAGNYTVVVTDNVEAAAGSSCSVTRDIVITQPAQILVTGERTHIVCAGNNDGAITIDVIGGTGNYTYSWSSANGTGLVQGQKDQTGLTGGTYSVTVTDDNGCTTSRSFEILEPDPLAFDLDVTPTNCANENRIEIINQTGGSGTYSYMWAGPGVPAGFNGTVLNNLPGGDYTVVMTDVGVGQQCQLTQTVSLVKALIASYSVQPSTCAGSNNGSITVTVANGEIPYTFAWTTADGSGLSPTEQNQSGLSAGHYQVTVTDHRGCSQVLDIEVTIANSISVAGSISHVRCFNGNGGAIDITVTGGSGNYLFNWSGPGTFNAVTEDVSALSAGSYTVEVIDADLEATGAACRVSKTFIVNQPVSAISVTGVAATDVLCNGSSTGAINITVSGGTAPYRFNWAGPGNIADPTNEDISNLVAGDYNVTITDANDCVLNFGPITISEPAGALTASIVEVIDVTVNGGSNGAIEIDVDGGAGSYAITWFDAADAEVPGSANLNRVEGLTAGTYRVEITDGNGCFTQITGIQIRQPNDILNLVITHTNVGPCFGADNGTIGVNLIGGTLPYQSITLFDGGGQVGQTIGKNNAYFTNLPAGDYDVVGLDANGIEIRSEVSILQPPALNLTAVVSQQVECYQASTGIISVTVNGGWPRSSDNLYRVSLTGGPTGTNAVRNPQALENVVFNNLPEGTYTVRVIDDSNEDGLFDVNHDCYKQQVLTITQPEALLTLSAVSGSEELCEGELPTLQIITANWPVASQNLEVTLSDGETYSVDDSPFLFQPVSIPADGITLYTITAVEIGGCTKGTGQGTATVEVHPLPTARIFGDPQICYGETTNLGIELTGVAPWSVTISDGSNSWNEVYNQSYNSFAVSPLVDTSYEILSVTDGNCSNVGTGLGTVTVHELPAVTLTGNADICAGASATLSFNFSNGTAPWTVTIRENGVQKVLGPISLASYNYSVSPVSTTDYELVSVADVNGCQQATAGSVRVTVRPWPEMPSLISGPDIICQGASALYSVEAVANATGYVWTLPVGASIISGAGTRQIEVEFATTAQSGNLSVYATNSCGNGPVRTLQVNVDKLPTSIGGINGPTELCQGSTGIIYQVDPVVDAALYNWSVPAGFSIVDGLGTAIITVDLDPNVDNSVGVITVTPENDCGESINSSNLTVVISALPVAYAGEDQNLCGNLTSLNADPLSYLDWSGHWEVISGSATIVAPTSPNSQVTNLSRGDVVLRWTVTHNITGCGVSDEVTLRNNQLAVVAAADQSLVCGGASEIYGTPVPGYPNTSGRWTFVTGYGTFESASSATTMVTDLAPDTNRLRWTLTQNGCESVAETVIINNQPDQAVIDGEEIVNLCTDAATLNANVPLEGTGVWTVEQGAATIDNVNSSTINVSSLSKGENILRWTITKGSCSTFDEVMLRNNLLVVSAGDDKTTCEDLVSLDATQPQSGVLGTWEAFGAASGVVQFSNGSSATSVVSNLVNGENRLRWTLSKNGCESYDEVIITGSKPTTSQVGSTQTICGSSTVLTGNVPVMGVGRWSVIEGSGSFVDVNDPLTEVTGLKIGTNVFRWTIMNGGCSSYSDLVVTNVQVNAYAGKDTVVCDRNVILGATSVPAGYTGHWSMIPGIGGVTFSDGGLSNPKALVRLDYGLNGLMWNVVHTESGCSTSDEVYILVNSPNPTEVDAGADQEIGGGGEAFLNASSLTRGTGVWTLVSGGGDIDQPDNPATLVTGLRQGPNVFRWTVTVGSCSAYDEVTVTNGDVIDANAGPNQTICSYETYLQANEPDVAIGVWELVSGAGKFDNRYDPQTRVFDLGTEGDNVFRWTISYGIGTSSSSDEVTIINNTPDEANAGLDDVICDDQYLLKGNTPSPGMGSVSWTLISGSGTIADSLVPETMVTGLSQGNNVMVYTIEKGDAGRECYSVDSVIITNGLATEAIAGDDQVVCKDSATLRPNVPNYGVGEWRVVEGSATFEGNWAKDLAPGVNRLAWVISTDLCDSRDTVEIVNNAPSVSLAGEDQPICRDEAKLSGSVPVYGTGEWTPISGSGNIADVTDPYSEVTGLAKGRNRFRWTINNNGCLSSDEVEIINNLIEADAGDSQTLCADTAVLAANNPSPGAGIWGILGGSGSAVFDDPEDPYSVVRDLDQGENILTWTVNNEGCSTVSQVTLINNLPTQADAGPNRQRCENNVVLAANNPTVGTGSWSIRNGSGTFADPGNPNTSVNDLNFGSNIYRWTIENNGCRLYDDVQIDYNSIESNAGADDEICSNEYILEANNASPGIGTWTVVGGTSQAVFEDVNDPATRVFNLRKGRNVLRWSINYAGCETYSEVAITNNIPSTSYAGNTETVCADEIILDATAPETGTGHWEVLSGSGTMTDFNDPHTNVTGLSKGDNVFRWVVQNGVCSSDDEVLVVNNLPSVPYAGADKPESCSSSVELRASTPEYGEGLWSILEGGANISDPTDPRASLSNLMPGTNRFRWTLTKGQCTLSDDITIVNNTPTIANAGPDVADCKNWSALDANTPVYGTGEWSLVSGQGSFINPIDENTNIENLGFGENVLMWTISNGKCFSTDQVTIFNKVPDQADAGKDQTFCESYTMLNANDPTSGIGQWSVVSGAGEFEDPQLFNTKVVNVGFGDNVYKWTVGYGECTTEDEVIIRSNKSYAYAGEDVVVYDPEVTLNSNNVGNLQAGWSVVGGAGTFEDPSFFNTSVTGLNDGINTFRWSIDVNGCVAFDDVSIDYRPVPDAGFITDVTAGCYPLQVKFTNYSVGATNFHWDFGDGNSSGDRNPIHVFEEGGDFTVTLTTPGPDGKDGVAEKVIQVYDHPEAAFQVSPQLVYVPGDQVRFTNLSVGGLDYLWNFGDGLLSSAQNPMHSYQDEGIYDVKLHVTNQYGCSDSLLMEEAVTAKLAGFITFPNAFSPRPGGSNGTSADLSGETNTVFKPVYRDVDAYQLQVFNRWGQLIFQSNDVDQGWDGLYKGSMAPQAVYVWKVSGTFINGVAYRQAGSVLLVR